MPAHTGLTPGDWATIVGAAATTFVGIVALWVAIRDGRRLREEREARSRLVAAYLNTPLARAYSLMSEGILDLAAFAGVMAGRESVKVAAHAERLRQMCVLVPPLLGKFNVADASSLPGNIGANLADALGEAHAVIEWITPPINKYLSTFGSVPAKPDDIRFEAASSTAPFVELFKKATNDLGGFVAYCRKDFAGSKG